MAIVVHDCWQCELCGWVWIKHRDTPPIRCPGRGCRRMGWNKSGRHDACVHCGKALQGRQRMYCSLLCKSRARQSTATGKDEHRKDITIMRGQDGKHHALCSCIACLMEITAEIATTGRSDRGIARRVRKAHGVGPGGSYGEESAKGELHAKGEEMAQTLSMQGPSEGAG